MITLETNYTSRGFVAILSSELARVLPPLTNYLLHKNKKKINK